MRPDAAVLMHALRRAGIDATVHLDEPFAVVLRVDQAGADALAERLLRTVPLPGEERPQQVVRAVPVRVGPQ